MNLTEYLLDSENIETVNQYKEALETLEVSVSMFGYDIKDFFDTLSFIKNGIHLFYIADIDGDNTWTIWSTNLEFHEKINNVGYNCNRLKIEELIEVILKII